VLLYSVLYTEPGTAMIVADCIIHELIAADNNDKNTVDSVSDMHQTASMKSLTPFMQSHDIYNK